MFNIISAQLSAMHAANAASLGHVQHPDFYTESLRERAVTHPSPAPSADDRDRRRSVQASRAYLSLYPAGSGR